MGIIETHNARMDSLIKELENDISKKEMEIELLKRGKVINKKYYCCHCRKELGEPHDLICNTIVSPFSKTEVNLCHRCAIQLDNTIMDFFDISHKIAKAFGQMDADN